MGEMREMREMRTSNIEHRTPNVELMGSGNGQQRVYDLEDRLLEYAARIIALVERLPRLRSGNHIAGQLLRSGTSPLSNHGEAEAAESPEDFVHKLKVSLKELRESHRWLRLVRRVPLIKPATEVDPLIGETDELIRIFVTSIRTSLAKNRMPPSSSDTIPRPRRHPG